MTSQHFEVGSFVIYRRQQAEVIDWLGKGRMMIRYDDNRFTILRPYGLQWEE